MDAILETPIEHGNVVVQPLTISRMALLELVKSPFVVPDTDFTIQNMPPSCFIMCADKKELRGFNSTNIESLIEKSFEWCDEIGLEAMPQIIEDTMAKFRNISKVSPATGAKEESENKSGNA